MSSITNPRTKSSGLAERTLKNLAFVEKAHRDQADVHVVTQVVNSLLALLIFPVEAEEAFFSPFTGISLPSSLHPSPSEVPSLQVAMFDQCGDMATFFKRIRNALSHKNIEFDSDSLILSDVTVTLKDRKKSTVPFNWEVAMTAQDLRAIGVYLGNEIVAQGL